MNNLKFMDFCAGIGGGRLGLQENGLTCVAHSEIDNSPNATYRMFFGESEQNFGDLMKIDTKQLPDFDVLIGGFPCQTFSIVGKREGFDDNRGLIIYGLIKILKDRQIPVFVLENVKGLESHNSGQTLATILSELDNAGYNVTSKVLNSIDYGVAQMRERIYIVGIKKGLQKNTFEFPQPIAQPNIWEFLTDTNNDFLDKNHPTFQKYINNKYNKGRFSLDEILSKDFLVIDTRQSDLRLYENKCPTLRTGRHGILYVRDGKLKKLSGYEALLLQGFPKELADIAKKQQIPNGRLLSQAGNAMTVNVISLIGKELINSL